MVIAFNEGRLVHAEDGHTLFVLFARENYRNSIFIKNVCLAVKCDTSQILIGCIPNWVGKSVTPSIILVTEERAQGLAERYPHIIHFFYNESDVFVGEMSEEDFFDQFDPAMKD